MRKAIAHKREERESNVQPSRGEREGFVHPRGHGSEGGAPSSLEEEVASLHVKLECVCGWR